MTPKNLFSAPRAEQDLDALIKEYTDQDATRIASQPKPKLKSDGTPDLSGLKIRSSGLYRAWLTSMGATNVMPIEILEASSTVHVAGDAHVDEVRLPRANGPSTSGVWSSWRSK